MKLYSTLADWWPLLSAPEDYAEEAAHHWRVLTAHARRPIQTLLELGCGGGNNAFHLKQSCRITLSDLSPRMLAVSRRLNPECEHVEGDMRSLRLDREFDAVFVHDAVMYLTTEEDLRRTLRTAFAHCAAGGAALLVPDYTRETWSSATSRGGHDGDDRALRYLSWTWDPDPTDSEYAVEMVYLLRASDGAVRVEHERHRCGLFATDTWLTLLKEVGFQPSVESCAYPGGESARCFIGLRAIA
ncbi:MAG: class I SAM-dependent methyltransferase [Phycisphaerae bacterium]